MALFGAVFLRGEEANSNDSGLKWLAYHQEPDGHWDAKKYSAAKSCDTLATSLALLAFLGAGHSEKVGEYKDNVKRAVAWLKSKQTADGKVSYKPDAASDDPDPTALATLALCEAAAMANVENTRTAAQKAVDYCASVYPIKAGEGNAGRSVDEKASTSTVYWHAIALKSAKVAGLHVDHGAIDAVNSYLDSVEYKVQTDERKYEGASIYWHTRKQQTTEGHSGQRVTAGAMVARQFLGRKGEDLAASAAYLVKTGGAPVWEKDGANVDLCCWWLTTLSLYQQDGQIWRDWFVPMKKALIEHQRHNGDDAGSWDPAGAGTEWGRVGQTALACLALEVYYRYQQLTPEK